MCITWHKIGEFRLKMTTVTFHNQNDKNVSLIEILADL